LGQATWLKPGVNENLKLSQYDQPIIWR